MTDQSTLPGKQWIPSNGTVGEAFLEDWCGTCARDRAMREGVPYDECDDTERCDIIAASFRGEAVEWRLLPGGDVKCLAYVPAGEPIPQPKCERTADMFEAP
ncbi:MAG TPA: hypothetical protein PKC22_11520 [Rhodocyclaceae bacterium]|nr:hypothetical protein [Rhodocyclaceae bacterium]